MSDTCCIVDLREDNGGYLNHGATAVQDYKVTDLVVVGASPEYRGGRDHLGTGEHSSPSPPNKSSFRRAPRAGENGGRPYTYVCCHRRALLSSRLCNFYL